MITRRIPAWKVGLVIALFLVACGDSTRSLDIQTIDRGSYGNGTQFLVPQVLKIDDQGAWDEFWIRHKSFVSPPPEQPNVDFSRNSIIAVLDVNCPSGGYSIDIKEVSEQDNSLHVQATRSQPGQNCIVTMSFTQPFHIVRIDKSDLQPVLLLSTETYACSQ